MRNRSKYDCPGEMKRQLAVEERQISPIGSTRASRCIRSEQIRVAMSTRQPGLANGFQGARHEVHRRRAVPFDEEQRRDQVARQHEEHVDAEETAGCPMSAEVERHDRDDGDGAETVERGLIAEARLCPLPPCGPRSHPVGIPQRSLSHTYRVRSTALICLMPTAASGAVCAGHERAIRRSDYRATAVTQAQTTREIQR
jgi:hypothetical protein